jgi:N-hydroxyarylamine O-acetyltransferase
MSFVESYLKRIDYQGSSAPTLQTLQDLTLHHTLSIPFETIDLVLRVPISLEIPILFEKIVTSKRGGYCYELNLLFGELLKRLHFDVRYALAYLMTSEGTVREDSVHLVLVVNLENGDLKDQWLVDVSWSKGLVYPVNLSISKEQTQFLNQYRCVPTSKATEVWEKQPLSDWKKIYFVSSDPINMDLVHQRNAYHQSDASSEFYRKLVIVQALKEGFISLRNLEFTKQERGERVIQIIHSEASLHEALRHFNLERFSNELWKGQ